MSAEAPAPVPGDIVRRILDNLEHTSNMRVEQAAAQSKLTERFEAHIARHQLVNDRLWKAFWTVLGLAGAAMLKLVLG